MIYTLQNEINLIKATKNTVYSFNYYADRYELDSQLELLDVKIQDIVNEVNIQFNNDIQTDELKTTIRGIKNVIINQLGRDNARKWKQWEENASYQSIYQENLADIFGNYHNNFYDKRGFWGYDYNLNKETPTKVITKAVSKYPYERPSKKLKYVVILTEEVSIFIKKMMVLYSDIEWGVAFTFTIDHDNKQIIIDKVYIMPVTQGSGHVTFVNESEYVIFSDISELGEFVTDINNETRFAGIMHSHHTMGSWHSSTDHGTIDVYINDFKAVLSIVWSHSKIEDYVDNDIILQNKKDKYLINDLIFDDNIKVKSDEFKDIDNKWVNQYNDMIAIVKKDYDNYEKFLKRFDSTKKYIKINELYSVINNEDIKCDNINIMKELI